MGVEVCFLSDAMSGALLSLERFQPALTTGKLKELGNTVLNKFGMSLDNFKAEKDPNTGSYSIKFQQ